MSRAQDQKSSEASRSRMVTGAMPAGAGSSGGGGGGCEGSAAQDCHPNSCIALFATRITLSSALPCFVFGHARFCELGSCRFLPRPSFRIKSAVRYVLIRNSARNYTGECVMLPPASHPAGHRAPGTGQEKQSAGRGRSGQIDSNSTRSQRRYQLGRTQQKCSVLWSGLGDEGTRQRGK